MKAISVFLSFVIALAASLAVAQEAPQFPAPQKEHEWLQRFVGEWETDAEASMGPGQPPLACTGTIHSRALGGFWIVSELKSEMMGVPITAVQTIGYDPESKKYIGSWVDSMMNYMWKYEGAVDEAGKTLTLEAEGPNFMQAGKSARFRDAYEFKSKDHIVMTSSMQGEDGAWVTFMTGNARRKK